MYENDSNNRQNENIDNQDTNTNSDSIQSGADQQDDKQAAERFHRDFYESLEQNDQIGDQALMDESERDLGSTTEEGSQSSSQPDSESDQAKA